MNEREILQRSIEDHQTAIDKAERELDALEVTYSIGDRFVERGTVKEKKTILIQVDYDKVIMATLGSGNRYEKPTSVFRIKKPP